MAFLTGISILPIEMIFQVSGIAWFLVTLFNALLPSQDNTLL